MFTAILTGIPVAAALLGVAIVVRGEVQAARFASVARARHAEMIAYGREPTIRAVINPLAQTVKAHYDHGR